MDSTSVVCSGCGYRIEPIFVFERSPKTKKLYLITRCPKDSCNFNIDIEESTDPPKRRPINKKRDDGEGGKSFWRYGV